MNDLPLLAAWRSNPHVRAWWGSDGSHDAADLADPRVARWIVSNRRTPFAFMQDYPSTAGKITISPSFPRDRGGSIIHRRPEMIGVGHRDSVYRGENEGSLRCGGTGYRHRSAPGQ
ncbi:GNAT family N-acetyltransferase (plasmid) [Sinorhizobium meliloti]|nr:GNAT family N-acetyltransferase [Sinorhizobium meliloti]